MVVSANSISLAHLSIKRAKTRKPEARKGPIAYYYCYTALLLLPED